MPVRFSSVPRVVTSSPPASWIATPWCGASESYVSLFGFPSPSWAGSKIVTSPVPSEKRMVLPACRTTWPGLLPSNSTSVSFPPTASITRKPVDVETIT